MLAELHMHDKHFGVALNVLKDLYGLDRCRVCLLNSCPACLKVGPSSKGLHSTNF